ncbi:DUF389 domain-containing protein [Pseudonocardia oroxyli]|uniref:Uncharacterized hydrophobic domain-containing protein n=1 Tax=Pseudonocardia oroxyli TaxID=366584 RepID=A0A1G7IFR8_PSEOR|nr:DUF389 domain-containing protein [Pseudonocardia oroxyli]SDF11366.1 uncharacterized hydrophobic domain-containing protein [Pseudonocardia oroxyli]
MLHLRVVSPAQTTPQVLRLLEAEAGVAHLVLHRGAAVRPAGDVVEADVARECADALLSDLRTLDLDHDGALTLESLDTVLSDSADRAEEAAPGEGSDAVLWDELIARTGEESRLSFSFQAFLTIACLLAAIGAITDSAVLVVGAMVLGPEFGPLAAVAAGLVLRRRDLVRRGGTALAVGFPLGMAITAAATVLFDATGLLVSADLDGLDEVAFIYQVGPFSLIVALLAGVAGTLALTSAKSGSLVGVFISVTTVPAAAFASVAAVEGRWSEAGLSALQLLVNLVGIVVAAAGTLLVARWTGARRDRGRELSAG